MSNYIEYKDTIAFHPGYYIQELVEASGLTQEDYAKRLGTTPKNLSCLINGLQSLSIDMASKLSMLLGTTPGYWLNLQSAYDVVLAQMQTDKEEEEELSVLKMLGYSNFRDLFGLPDLHRKTREQAITLREYLRVSSLGVLRSPDLVVSRRCADVNPGAKTTVCSNAMIQVATNIALDFDSPKYDKKKFQSAVEYAVTQTHNHDSFLDSVKGAFLDAGVVLVAMPNLPGSKTNGATKRIGDSVMLMVSNRGAYADTFWFTLMHEAGHVLNSDFGASLENDVGSRESAADLFARNTLIEPRSYAEFVGQRLFTVRDIEQFAHAIDRDPGIVVGRLQNDGLVSRTDRSLTALRTKYIITPRS